MPRKTKAQLREAWLIKRLLDTVADFQKEFKREPETLQSHPESMVAIWHEVHKRMASKGGKKCQ